MNAEVLAVAVAALTAIGGFLGLFWQFSKIAAETALRLEILGAKVDALREDMKGEKLAATLISSALHERLSNVEGKVERVLGTLDGN